MPLQNLPDLLNTWILPMPTRAKKRIIWLPGHLKPLPKTCRMLPRSDSTLGRGLVKLRRPEAVLHGPHGNLRSRADAELVADPLQVALDGAFGDEQLLGDGAAGHARRNHRCDLSLATAL